MKHSNHFLQELFLQILKPFESAILIDREGEVLGLKYETLADIGTLSAAAQTAQKYYSIESGDLVILNDPYSGGSLLSSVTLITALDEQKTINLAVRTGFRPNLVVSQKIEEEGLRIPPTPIGQHRVLNENLFTAITSDSRCPEGFGDRVRSLIQLMWKQIDDSRVLFKRDPDLIAKVTIKNFLNNSKMLALSQLAESPHGESSFEEKLESGETLKLKAQLSSQVIQFDFSGTSPSKKLALTDSAVSGACVGAWVAFHGGHVPLNSGVFSLVQVMTPLGCFLNAKYPSPTFRGMTEGTTLVAHAVTAALNKLATKQMSGESAQVPLQLSFEFDIQNRFFDSLPGGIGATSTHVGSDGIHFWTRNKLKNSIQEIESRFPLRVLKSGIRLNSGGKGKFRGGNGVIKEYELLAPAKLRWLMEQINHPPKGTQGGHDGQAPLISILTPTGEKIDISTHDGEKSLPVHSKITASSSGGGGYGAANNT